MFTIRYATGGSSKGVLATERFTFESSDEGITIVNDVVFGCSRKISNTRNLMGVFGLATHRPGYSIVKKMGNKLSYCIGNLYDKDYKYNQISLGEGTFLDGAATPLTNYRGLYHVDLEGISLGDKRLDIDPNLFKRSTSYGKDGVAIDTGAPYTWLVSEAFYVLRAEIAKVTDGLGLTRQYDPHVLGLCYSGTGNTARDLPDFPLMTFHLGNGADLVLDTTSMFYQFTARMYCLAFGPSSQKGYDYFSVIGVLAQQNHNIAYDLIGKKLYIQKIECSLLDED
ncbi:hypothetical protein Patl1_14585 [Pistacia atlantica]|uniref:Uncharacterized protein n=1 Tax=Pistacia atlantica TaxID=434234 RepID=A0ACC1AXA8_9ROSI|nr:hypothetical protein Patl1_14585 [Pistacia atlantica]